MYSSSHNMKNIFYQSEELIIYFIIICSYYALIIMRWNELRK